MPGGGSNPDRGMDGWIEAYAQLRSFARRLETQSRTSTSDDELERAVWRAASRAPVPVELSVGSHCVYPKSAWALWFLDSLDAIARPLAELTLEIAEADPDVRGMPALAQGLAWRTWVWILTHADVGLPFDDEGAIEPPAWTADLIAEDFVAIYLAHKALHYDASAIMGQAFPREQGEKSRLSLSGFLAGFASEKGLKPSDMFRRFAMPEALAMAVSAAEAHRVAKANAKREAPDA